MIAAQLKANKELAAKKDALAARIAALEAKYYGREKDRRTINSTGQKNKKHQKKTEKVEYS